MMRLKSLFLQAALLGCLSGTDGALAQSRTVGLFLHDPALSWNGYTLLYPKQYTSTYLINNAGRIVHSWSASTYPPGQSVYLLPNGHLLRSCRIQGQLGTGGGEGGRIEEYDWSDSLVWQFTYSTTTYQAHHDIRPLPNGNVLLLAVEKKSVSQLLAAGFDPARFQPEVTTKGFMLPDHVIEVHPTPPAGGVIVWEWHVWDHLIQDFDSTRQNFGVVSDHPERIDADGDGRQLPVFWNHMNAVNYNPELDQIMLSVRGNSEVWIIDHSTTTAEAAGHSGGRYGKGGDLLYRWGNPVCYHLGSTADQMLQQQHDGQWIDSTSPGAGNILVFNNGLTRGYSTIDEFATPVDGLGNYWRSPGAAFGPTQLTWTYAATPPPALYAPAISGAQRLPNGNTLVCDGTHGVLFEVTPAGQTVWRYVSPVVGTGPMTQGDSIPEDPTHPGEYMNMVFRTQRYATDHPGLAGRDLTPGDFIERYTTVSVEDTLAAGWNMVSNPVNVENDSLRSLFPQSSLDHGFWFAPGSGYEPSSRLANGRGYWGKFPGPAVVALTGLPRLSDSIAVSAGWNMVGTISSPVDTAAVGCVPPGLRASAWYGYGPSGYFPVQTLVPGHAYWMKAGGPGEIILAAP
jgi:hypothetical protein